MCYSAKLKELVEIAPRLYRAKKKFLLSFSLVEVLGLKVEELPTLEANSEYLMGVNQIQCIYMRGRWLSAHEVQPERGSWEMTKPWTPHFHVLPMAQPTDLELILSFSYVARMSNVHRIIPVYVSTPVEHVGADMKEPCTGWKYLWVPTVQQLKDRFVPEPPPIEKIEGAQQPEQKAEPAIPLTGKCTNCATGQLDNGVCGVCFHDVRISDT